jgi:CHAT domain-containing protein
MDKGLRALPVAALHDGQKFLVEQYTVGLMPSLSLTDTRYVSVKDLNVLGMGAQTFSDPIHNPLPGVAAELGMITEQLWPVSKKLLDEDFTEKNLRDERESRSVGILHLATHANFEKGELSNSYIQLWGNQKITLNRFRDLKLYDPPMELMTLSACQTALGDENAELGFTGLAAQAGVKSVMGSLWNVSDEGTLGFMTTFYGKLKEPAIKIKAEALRETQRDMLGGKVQVVGSQLMTAYGPITLPRTIMIARGAKRIVAQPAEGAGDPGLSSDGKFEHPYFWSGFTMVGSPW